MVETFGNLWELPCLLGRHGNRVMRLTSPARKGWALASFPVKMG